jgi:hypothetical protein
MQFLNKDIKGIILSNINFNEIKKLIKTTKNMESLILLMRIYNNEVSYTVHDDSHYAILESNILNKRYDIPVPKTIKKGFFKRFTWLECLDYGIFVINQRGKIIYVNIITQNLTVLLPKRKILSYSINKDSSTLALCYRDYKLKARCLKIFDSTGNVVYHLNDFKPLVKDIIFDKDKLFFILRGRKELRYVDLIKNEDNSIYKKSQIHGLYLKSNKLLTTIKNAILLFDTMGKDIVSVIKLDITPQVFYSLSAYSFLVLHGNNFLYDFNIQSLGFKRLYFEFDRYIESYNLTVYSESEHNLIILIDNLYYIYSKSNMSCIFIGYFNSQNFYIDVVGNKILSFNYSRNINKNLFLEIQEYELIDFTKVININEIFSNKDRGYDRIYNLPTTKNLLIHLKREELFYYNYYRNTAVKLFNAKGHIVPVSSLNFCYIDNEDIISYNIINNTRTYLLKCSDISLIQKLNNFLFIIHENNIIIYDLVNKCISLIQSFFGKVYVRESFFDKLIYISASGENNIYTVQKGKVGRLWNEASSNVFNIYNDEKNVYVFTRDSQMVCINRNLDLNIQPTNVENIDKTNLNCELKDLLLKYQKQGFRSYEYYDYYDYY